MQQRVGIARALAIEPKVLLLDEPLANVDSQTGEVLIDEFLKIFDATKKTVIYVTHDIDEAIYIADKTVVLSARPGHILEILDVKLPKPRWKNDVRSMTEFGVLRSKLRQSLRLTAQ
jgi:NitT/TauT family transport system ATP-binding protein